MSYVDTVRAHLAAYLPDQGPALLDLYALLALTRGAHVTGADVHNAWALWRSRSRADHPDLVPFEQLAADVQALDEPFAAAIRQAVEAAS